MKVVGTFFVTVALLLFAMARAQDASDTAAAKAALATDKPDAATTDKPYATIVARNMFGLLPIPPPPPAVPPEEIEPPPKITANGIMTIFGRKEALFKVTPKPKPGQQPKEQSYVMGEGEMQDEITVVKIDDANSLVTFNNHGKVQELPLVAASSGPAAPAGPGGPAPKPGINRFVGGGPGANMNNVSPADRAAFRGRRPLSGMQPPDPQPNAAQMASAQPMANPGFNPTAPTQPSQNIEDQVMNAAQEMAQIELNRIATQEAVDKGLMPPLPPTMLTPPDATAQDGTPLIAPSQPLPQNFQPPNRR